MLKALLALLLVSSAATAQLAVPSGVPGQSLYVQGVIHAVYLPPGAYASTHVPASTGSVVEISWEHDDDSAFGPRTVTVRRERLPNQSVASFMSAFHADVQAMLALYPPNVPPEIGRFSEATLSVSWQHDLDGAGPLTPITVTSSIEKRASESSEEAARRLKQQTEALSAVFPPNVGPETP